MAIFLGRVMFISTTIQTAKSTQVKKFRLKWLAIFIVWLALVACWNINMNFFMEPELREQWIEALYPATYSIRITADKLDKAAFINRLESKAPNVKQSAELLIAAAATAAAYNDSDSVEGNAILTKFGFTKDQSSNDKSSIYKLTYNFNGEAKVLYILAYRGTQNFKDIVDDNSPINVSIAGTNAHVRYGILRYTNEASQNLRIDGALIEDAVNAPNASLIVAGHSLGGGSATIASSILSSSIDESKMSVVTFAALAVGDEEFKKLFGDKLHLTRVVNHFDSIVNKDAEGDLFTYLPHVTKPKVIVDITSWHRHGMEGYLNWCYRNYLKLPQN
jgi:hypothetical protein